MQDMKHVHADRSKFKKQVEPTSKMPYVVICVMLIVMASADSIVNLLVN